MQRKRDKRISARKLRHPRRGVKPGFVTNAPTERRQHPQANLLSSVLLLQFLLGDLLVGYREGLTGLVNGEGLTDLVNVASAALKFRWSKNGRESVVIS